MPKFKTGRDNENSSRQVLAPTARVGSQDLIATQQCHNDHAGTEDKTPDKAHVVTGRQNHHFCTGRLRVSSVTCG